MRDDAEDWSSRERRGELTPSERRRLKIVLDGSPEARLLHHAGLAFDAEGKAMPGDDAITERVTARVLARMQAPIVPPRKTKWPLVGAVAACLASIAVAGLANVYLRHETAPAIDAIWPSDGAETPPDDEPRAEAAPTPSATPEVPPSVVGRKPKSDIGRAKDENAPELFAAAARARREGDLPKAIALYDKLQRRFPGASESQAADMALGMLHARRGAHAPALAHFERYLAHSPRGELAPEAMWGQAQSLSSLGRSEEARRSLNRLQARYPDSPYAIQARVKLESEASSP